MSLVQPIQTAIFQTPRAGEVTQANWARHNFTLKAQSQRGTGLRAAHWPDFHQSHHSPFQQVVDGADKTEEKKESERTKDWLPYNVNVLQRPT